MFVAARSCAGRELTHMVESIGCRAAEEQSLPRLVSPSTVAGRESLEAATALMTDRVGKFVQIGAGAAERAPFQALPAQLAGAPGGPSVAGFEKTLKLAREVITDSASRRRNALLARLEHLTAGPRQLLPDARAVLAKPQAILQPVQVALDRDGSTGGITDAAVSDFGNVTIVRRDLVDSPWPVALQPPVPPMGTAVCFDPRLSIGRDGLLSDTGGSVAHWPRSPELTVGDLDRDWIGHVPDSKVGPVMSRADTGSPTAMGRLSQTAATETISGAAKQSNEVTVTSRDDDRAYRAQ